MKTILLLLGCLISVASFSQTTNYNHLFGGEQINIVSSDTTLPNLVATKEDCIDLFRSMNFRSGKMYITCDASESKRIVHAGDLSAIKREVKRCEYGVTVTLVGCILKDSDGKKCKPFNQIIQIK